VPPYQSHTGSRYYGNAQQGCCFICAAMRCTPWRMGGSTYHKVLGAVCARVELRHGVDQRCCCIAMLRRRLSRVVGCGRVQLMQVKNWLVRRAAWPSSTCGRRTSVHECRPSSSRSGGHGIEAASALPDAAAGAAAPGVVALPLTRANIAFILSLLDSQTRESHGGGFGGEFDVPGPVGGEVDMPGPVWSAYFCTRASSYIGNYKKNPR
jgi:hypothetical protein